MTRQRYDGHSTAFGLWLRKTNQALIGSHTFSAQNLDYIWHNYRENWLITIEEKRFGGMRNRRAALAQNDTHYIVAQMLAAASGMKVQTLRGLRMVEYRGHYNVVFVKESPCDGLAINGVESSESDLIQLLSTGCLTAQAEAKGEHYEGI